MLTLILLLLALSAQANDFPPHAVVLMYHRFDENQYPTTNVRMGQFRAQLDYLQQQGFTIWPVRRILEKLFKGGVIPDKTVAITVDDAYLSFYQHAYPELKRRGLPATVFVNTKAVQRSAHGYMSWAQMREMQQHNIDFANHGAGHLHLTHRKKGENAQQWLARIREDISEAQRLMDKELGLQGQRLFAYPFGEYNIAVAKLLRDMGYLAFGQHSGAIGQYSSPTTLPRFPINEHYSPLRTFSVKVSSLPMPLDRYHPYEPEIGQNDPPLLTLKLNETSGLRTEQINCFQGSGHRLNTKIVSPHKVSVQASSQLRKGRSRYNCTAPAVNGRYYWFSHPWFNGPDPADPGY